jgi:hypothetical protein
MSLDFLRIFLKLNFEIIFLCYDFKIEKAGFLSYQMGENWKQIVME